MIKKNKNRRSPKPAQIFRYIDSLYNNKIISSEDCVWYHQSSILRYKYIIIHCTTTFTIIYSNNKSVTVYRDLHEDCCNTLYYARIALAFDRALRGDDIDIYS